MILFESNSEKTTKKIAKKLAKQILPGTIIAFYGDLGSGKTTFIQGLCEFWQVKEYVNSPTFTLINEYNTNQGMQIFHFDCYRLGDSSEMEELGYEDFFFSDNVTLIEWTENIEDLIPESAIKIKIKYLDNTRREIVIQNLSEDIEKKMQSYIKEVS